MDNLRKGLVLLFVAAISLCLMAYDCGESAEVGLGYSYQSPQSFPQWTPDGARIVVELGRGIIYVVDTDGTNLRVLNDRSGNRYRDAHSPSLSPDGSQVVYSQRLKVKPPGYAASRLDYELVVSDIDGSNKRKLVENIGVEIAPAWSPDGNRIAYLSGDGSDFELFTVASDGSDLRRLAPNIYVSLGPPVWSPDGRQLAFLGRGEPNPSTNKLSMVVYSFGLDGTGLRRLSEPVSRPETLSLPAWSADSMSLYFLKVQNDGNAVLHRIALDSLGPQKIAEIPLHGSDWRRTWPRLLFWTPDGSEIRSGSYPFLAVKTDGPYVQDHSHLFPVFGNATWSPDGSKVAVNPRFVWDESASEDDEEVGLFIMSPDGSDKRVLIRYAGSGKWKDGKGEAWSPDYVR